MIAVLFGTFNAAHAANTLLAEDLERAGVELRWCHEPLWEETRDKGAAYFSPWSLAALGGRWLGAMRRLSLRFGEVSAGASWVVAGFNGQLDVLLARRLAAERSVLFAPLVTIGETLVDDRRRYRAGSLPARVLRALDRWSLEAADLVIADTEAHRVYMERELGVARGKVLVQYLGADESFCPGASPPTPEPDRPLRVLAYGSFLPLHGYDVVAEAARKLAPSDGIRLELIGSGPERAAVDDRVRDLPHVVQEDWTPYEGLPQRIRQSDVVLGVFGSSAKARMVVPNKVYQAAQVGRAIVTADTPAIREVFRPGTSIIVVEPEADAVAEALRELARDPERREALGRCAREDVLRAAGPSVRAERLSKALRARARVTEGGS